MRSRTNNNHGDDDDDSSAPGLDVGSWLWSASHDAHSGLIQFDFAKGGKPGGGGGGGGGGGTLLTEYVSGNPNVDNAFEYNVKIVFEGGNWTTALQHDFSVCADQLSKYITADVPNTLNADDITIYASLVRIDGPGRILGQAGPTGFRPYDGTDASFLPDTAIMQFDTFDASNFSSQGLMDDIAFHEMLHSIGFGTIWDEKGLLSGGGTVNPTFTGQSAVAYYDTHGGVGNIPVEQDGGAGTRDSHWDDQTFGNEIMTGYINTDNYLSYMTVASLDDIGYSVVSLAGYEAPTFI